MSTLEQALAPRPALGKPEIYGNIPDFLREWHGNLPEPLRTRIHLAGYIPNIELQKKQSQARISLCTSLYRRNAPCLRRSAVRRGLCP